jgi:hypothetical protein
MSATSIVSAISASVHDVASILEGIKKIAGLLNTPRSGVLVCENFTKRELIKIDDNHVHGGFVQTPPGIIAPETVMICGVENKAGSIGTGTEGTLTYQLAGTEIAFLMYECIPYVGINKCSAGVFTIQGSSPLPGGPPILFPYFDDEYKTVATCGVGKQGAEMRFSLLKGLHTDSSETDLS